MKNLFLFSMMMAFIQAASASEIQSQTNTGTGNLTEQLTYQGNSKIKNAPKDDAFWDWNLGYTYSAITLGATSVSTPTTPGAAVDHTSSFLGGVEYSHQWTAGLDFTTTKTPEENISSFGPSVHVGYTFEFGQKKKPSPKKDATQTPAIEETEEEPFVPTWNFTFTGGTTKYDQTLATGAPRPGSLRKINPGIKAQLMQQKQAEIATTFSGWEWLDLKLALTKYSYDHDVATFLANLDDPRAIQSGMASFGSTLSGFSSSQSEFDVIFHFPLDFDLESDLSQSTNAADGTKTNTFKENLYKTWADTWKTGLGFERDKSSTLVQNLFIATLAYEF